MTTAVSAPAPASLAPLTESLTAPATSLPAAAPREHIHTRQVTTGGYLRADGLWDIEAELADTKSYFYRNADGRERPAGDPVHHMKIRLTLDDSLTVREVASAMPGTPFPECQGANSPLQGIVGVTVGAGWRKAIEAAMGGVRGCTHLRELLATMGTVAFQTIPNYRGHQRRERGEAVLPAAKPGHQMGKCLGWDYNGPVVARVAPQFVGWIVPARVGGLSDSAGSTGAVVSPPKSR